MPWTTRRCAATAPSWRCPAARSATVAVAGRCAPPALTTSATHAGSAATLPATARAAAAMVAEGATTPLVVAAAAAAGAMAVDAQDPDPGLEIAATPRVATLVAVPGAAAEGPGTVVTPLVDTLTAVDPAVLAGGHTPQDAIAAEALLTEIRVPTWLVSKSRWTDRTGLGFCDRDDPV